MVSPVAAGAAVVAFGGLGAVAVAAKRQVPAIWSFKRLTGKVAGGLIPIKTPDVVSGEGSLSQVAEQLKKLSGSKPLIVTSPSQVKYGALKTCTDALEAAGMAYEVLDNTMQDPTAEFVEEGFSKYQASACDSIIALGGGSPMDAAKAVCAKATNPRPVKDYEGFLQVALLGVMGRAPPVIAVPTTAGTGSETTLAAVITLKGDTHRKIQIMDTELTPKVAILDPLLLRNLPPHVTAATGMDALTHAIESYVSRWRTEASGSQSLSAVKKMFAYLPVAYRDGSNMEAREATLKASFEAGMAFGRASVGYVHAIAHQFGALFATPHGAANAMLLPRILEFYLEGVDVTSKPHNCGGCMEPAGNCPCLDELCDLGLAAGVAAAGGAADVADAAGAWGGAGVRSAEDKEKVARKLIARLRELLGEMSMALSVPQMMSDDVPEVARRALQEAHGELHKGKDLMRHLADLGYPVPKHMTLPECEQIVSEYLPAEESKKWKDQSPT